MLWLCLDFPMLGRDAVGADEHTAVLGQRGNHRWLINAVDGLHAGTALAAARARMPKLKTLPRKPEAERELLHALAHALYQFGSPVVVEIIEQAEPYAVPRWRVQLEIGASLTLFGGLELLRDAALTMLMDWHMPARHAIAATRAAAGLLAQAGDTQPCTSVEALPTRLRPLAIQQLAWPGSTLDALGVVGLYTLGDLFAAPRETLVQRFGRLVLDDLDRLLGRTAEPFIALTPPSSFHTRFELHGEVENVETLLFPLRRMTQGFAAYLAACAVTCSQCTLELRHDLGADPTVIPLQLLSPSRDAAHWFELLKERLYRTPPRIAVRELLLSADNFTAIVGVQSALFDDHRLALARQATLEKLIARYGEHCLWRPALAADHRPEQAWQPASPMPSATPMLRPSRSPRPLWLLPMPAAIARQQVEDLPERIETGWWDDAPCTRDYHCVQLGERSAWVYRDRIRGDWRLHGLWE